MINNLNGRASDIIILQSCKLVSGLIEGIKLDWLLMGEALRSMHDTRPELSGNEANSFIHSKEADQSIALS